MRSPTIICRRSAFCGESPASNHSKTGGLPLFSSPESHGGIRVAFNLFDLGGSIGDKRYAIAAVLAAQHPNDLVGGRGCRIALGTLRGITGVTLSPNFRGDDIHGPSLCLSGMGPPDHGRCGHNR